MTSGFKDGLWGSTILSNIAPVEEYSKKGTILAISFYSLTKGDLFLEYNIPMSFENSGYYRGKLQGFAFPKRFFKLKSSTNVSLPLAVLSI